MALAAARRLVLQGLRAPAQKRGMADYHIPKPDTSMDHVFGDSSVKLPFNFQPPSATKTFVTTMVMFAVFGAPIWLTIYEDQKMDEFLAKLDAAKKAKEAASS